MAEPRIELSVETEAAWPLHSPPFPAVWKTLALRVSVHDHSGLPFLELHTVRTVLSTPASWSCPVTHSEWSVKELDTLRFLCPLYDREACMWHWLAGRPWGDRKCCIWWPNRGPLKAVQPFLYHLLTLARAQGLSKSIIVNPAQAMRQCRADSGLAPRALQWATPWFYFHGSPVASCLLSLHLVILRV